MNKLYYFLVILLYLLTPPEKAQAYLDPGNGSYLLQIVLAFAIGALYSLKLYWKRLKELLRKSDTKKGDDSDTF